jgi:hypothetical protein
MVIERGERQRAAPLLSRRKGPRNSAYVVSTSSLKILQFGLPAGLPLSFRPSAGKGPGGADGRTPQFAPWPSTRHIGEEPVDRQRHRRVDVAGAGQLLLDYGIDDVAAVGRVALEMSSLARSSRARTRRAPSSGSSRAAGPSGGLRATMFGSWHRAMGCHSVPII